MAACVEGRMEGVANQYHHRNRACIEMAAAENIIIYFKRCVCGVAGNHFSPAALNARNHMWQAPNH